MLVVGVETAGFGEKLKVGIPDVLNVLVIAGVDSFVEDSEVAELLALVNEKLKPVVEEF